MSDPRESHRAEQRWRAETGSAVFLLNSLELSLVSQERYPRKKKTNKQKTEMEVARRALWELERLPRVYEVEGRKGTLALNVSRDWWS